MRIGAGASVPEIRVSGKIEATTGGKAAGDVATAILIEAGSDVATIRNSGAITAKVGGDDAAARSEEHTSELQSLMRSSYAVFCLKKKKITSRNREGDQLRD